MRASLRVQLVKSLPAMQESPVRFLGQEDPWRRESLRIPVFWPMGSQRVSHEQGVKGPKIWPISNKMEECGALYQGHTCSAEEGIHRAWSRPASFDS